jgi:hypothetical protein
VVSNPIKVAGVIIDKLLHAAHHPAVQKALSAPEFWAGKLRPRSQSVFGALMATRPYPPIWRQFLPVGVVGSAEPDWMFWSRLGSLRAYAG